MSDGERHPNFCDCDTCLNGAHGMRLDGFTPRVVKVPGYRKRSALRRLPKSEGVNATIPVWQRRAMLDEAQARGVTLADVLREAVSEWLAARGAVGAAAE